MLDAKFGAVVCKYSKDCWTGHSAWSISYVQEMGNKAFIGCSFSKGATPTTSTTTYRAQQPQQTQQPQQPQHNNNDNYRVKVAAACALEPIESLLHMQVGI